MPTLSPEDSDASLRRLLDYEDIRQLVSSFARAIDTKDQPRYAGNFTDDGVLELPFGSIRGRAAIAAMKGPPPGTHAHHLFGQVDIDLRKNSASVITYMMATHVFSETSLTEKAHSGGWYEQEVVRTPQGWRFARVKLVIRWEDERPMIDAKDDPRNSKEND